MEKQTAVNWLLDQLLKDGYIERLPVLQFQQAKEMEKEQMKDAWDDGLFGKTDNFKQYYNETFNK